MKILLKSFETSLKLLKDKWVLFFALIPVLLGVIFYAILGGWLYVEVVGGGQEWINNYFSSGWLSGVVGGILVTLFSVSMYFIVSFSFIITVSLIACPFNDLLSSRVESVLVDGGTESPAESVMRMLKRVVAIIFNEVKKLSFILLMGLVAFLCGLTTILIPVTFVVTMLLLSAQFLDYSWCRHELSFRDCLQDVRENLMAYGSGAFVFSLLFAIPILNIIAFPFAIIFFSALFVQLKLHPRVEES